MSAPKVRTTPTRAFHEQTLVRNPGSTAGTHSVYVKNGYKLVPCTGEAHSNPHIDTCMSCLSGTWGWELVPEKGE